MAAIKTFEDLEIWKEGVQLAADIYELSKRGELAKDFGLKDQIRRSAVSIPSNIAEGFEYDNRKEFKRFLIYSKGSSGELRSHLTVLEKVDYIDKEILADFKNRLETQSKKTSSLIKYLNNYNGKK